MEKIKLERNSKRERPSTSLNEILENARLVLEIILTAILIVSAVISMLHLF